MMRTLREVVCRLWLLPLLSNAIAPSSSCKGKSEFGFRPGTWRSLKRMRRQSGTPSERLPLQASVRPSPRPFGTRFRERSVSGTLKAARIGGKRVLSGLGYRREKSVGGYVERGC